MLGQPWPKKSVTRSLGRMMEPLYERGELPPETMFDVDLKWRLRRVRPTTREYPVYA